MQVEKLVPFVHVADLERTIDFYSHFGLEVTARYEEEGWLLWAAMGHGGAEVMFALAGEEIHAHDQAVLLYLYSSDLDGLHRSLRANGISVGEIVDGSPGPDREFRAEDPDGYVLMVAST